MIIRLGLMIVSTSTTLELNHTFVVITTFYFKHRYVHENDLSSNIYTISLLIPCLVRMRKCFILKKGSVSPDCTVR